MEKSREEEQGILGTPCMQCTYLHYYVPYNVGDRVTLSEDFFPQRSCLRVCRWPAMNHAPTYRLEGLGQRDYRKQCWGE